MATFVIDRSDAELRVDGDALVLYRSGQRDGTVPIRMLDRVVLHGSRITLQTGVLMRLAESGAATIMLGSRSNRQAAIVLGPGHRNAATRIAQARRVTDETFCDAWARGLVASKVRQQRRLLARALAARHDIRKPLFDAIAGLEGAAARLASDETLHTSELRGIEGAAARTYFAGFGALFAGSLNFSGRNRRPPRDPVNACLSLGYTMLHFEAVRIAHMTGLDPLLGFYHRPAFGRESLASDLIEPMRPIVDAWVWEQFRTRALREDHFSDNRGACLLGRAGREIFYAGWEACARMPRRWLRLRACLLARFLEREGDAWVDHGDVDPEGDA